MPISCADRTKMDAPFMKLKQPAESHVPSNKPFRVALVCMPFYAASRPSIQIGLLTAIAEGAGFQTEPHYLNLELAVVLGESLYSKLSGHHYSLLGEWLFSVAAFGESAHKRDDEYFESFPEVLTWIRKQGLDQKFLLELRHEKLPCFLEQCLRGIDWARYDVVGFTSTFQQNVASLALARRIKERHEGVAIVMGGANMVGPMGREYLRAFSYIDFVVVGEGDVAFPDLLMCLSVGREPKEIGGILGRTPEGFYESSRPRDLCNLDQLPTPKYDEYFQRVRELDLTRSDSSTRIVPFESSRGCWWGQKHQCTFCGLNGEENSYRLKSPQKSLREISELARKYNATFFEATDNILSMSYIKDFFPVISEARSDYHFCYEVKANLTRQQLGVLWRGGVRFLQPGIESLNSHVLQLMRKGCSMLQNIRMLKWCRYYKINASWNLLWGFSGETEEDYRRQLEVMKIISHLEPPLNCGRFWLERFSPYFCDPGRFNVRQVRPHACYQFVYPEHVALEDVAYFFEGLVGDALSDECFQETAEWVREWQRRWREQTDSLVYRRTMDCLFIEDTRVGRDQGWQSFSGPMALIYEACGDTMRTVEQTCDVLESSPERYQYSFDEVKWALAQFCELGYMLEENGQYLSLAVPLNPNW